MKGGKEKELPAQEVCLLCLSLGQGESCPGPLPYEFEVHIYITQTIWVRAEPLAKANAKPSLHSHSPKLEEIPKENTECTRDGFAIKVYKIGS